MAHANLDKSKRLQSLLRILQGGGIYDTQYLSTKTGSMALHTDIHELRAHGVPVSKAIYTGKSKSGRKIYSYHLESTLCK